MVRYSWLICFLDWGWGQPRGTWESRYAECTLSSGFASPECLLASELRPRSRLRCQSAIILYDRFPSCSFSFAIFFPERTLHERLFHTITAICFLLLYSSVSSRSTAFEEQLLPQLGTHVPNLIRLPQSIRHILNKTPTPVHPRYKTSLLSFPFLKYSTDASLACWSLRKPSLGCHAY